MLVETSRPDPVTDPVRLLDISRYDIESLELHDKLNEFARRAAESLGQPVGFVTIVLDTAQYSAGMFGVSGAIAEAQGTPIEWSFCVNAVRSGHPYVVEDGPSDPLQCDNPLVCKVGVKSYAGAPLISSEGNVLGACCSVGFEPRKYTAKEIGELESLASEVVLELSNFPYIAN